MNANILNINPSAKLVADEFLGVVFSSESEEVTLLEAAEARQSFLARGLAEYDEGSECWKYLLMRVHAVAIIIEEIQAVMAEDAAETN